MKTRYGIEERDLCRIFVGICLAFYITNVVRKMDLIFDSILLGIGLAMDACAVSMANGLNEPDMKIHKSVLIAFMFALFQILMPLLGWVCVHFVAEQFTEFYKAVPYIALALLAFIGGKMIFEGCRHNKQDQNENPHALTFLGLLLQAIATSIDALSVGFTIAEYGIPQALLSAAIIGVITFAISFSAVFIGKKSGDKLGNKAEILGGIILIAIGIKIFVEGVFFA